MVSEKKTNDNIIKLRALSDKLCKHDFDENLNEKNYKIIIDEIKNIIDGNDISNLNEAKNKTYETTCNKIKIILKKFKIL